MPAGPVFLSPQWRELFRHAVREAERVGLELSLNIQSGWNLGGPLVTPERAAKLVTWSQTVISGPRRWRWSCRNLPDGTASIATSPWWLIGIRAEDPRGRSRPARRMREHPAAQAADGDPASFWVSGGLKPGEGPSSERPEWLQVTFPEPLSVAGARIVGRPGYGPRRGEVQVADAEGRFAVGSLSVEDGAGRRAVRHGPGHRLSIRVPRGLRSRIDRLAAERAGGGDRTVGRGRPRTPGPPSADRPAGHKLAMHESGRLGAGRHVLLDDLPSVPGEEDCRSGGCPRPERQAGFRRPAPLARAAG